MPVGVICNLLAVVLGGMIGAKGGSRLSDGFKQKLNLIFGVCSMTIGISSIVLMQNMPAVVLSIILGTILGLSVSAIAVPQAVIFLALFFCAKLIYPLTTPAMVNDFKACGGIIMLATGFRITKIRDFPIADMIPAMLLIWPVSWMWTAWILPLLG